MKMPTFSQTTSLCGPLDVTGVMLMKMLLLIVFVCDLDGLKKLI